MADPKGALSTLDPNASTETATAEKNILDTDGGLASIAVKSSVPKQGQLATLSAKDAGVLDPTNSKTILESMQKLIEQKEAQQNSLLTALNLASAYGSGGTEGPQRQVQAQMAQSSANQNDIYNMRLQKAQLEGQQASAQNLLTGLTAPIGGAPAGGAPSGGAPAFAPVGGVPSTGAPTNTLQQIIAQLPPDQQAMAKVLITQPGGVQKVMEMARVHSNIVSKENIGAQNKPEYYEKKIEIRIVGADGKEKIELVSLDDLKKNPNLGKITPQGSQTVEQMSSGTTASAPVTPSTDVAFGAKVPLDKIYAAFYAQESGSGKADTSKPNEFGVLGPMQIQDATFKGYQAKGVIPKEYRIDNPEDNLKAGKLILEDLYKQYGGDIEKVAAAYYGGPGAINKDGTINLERKPIRTNPATGKPYDVNDPKKPRDPTVGEYIDQIKKRIEGEPVIKKPTEARTIPEMRSESELNKEREKALIASDTKKREEFEASTKPMDLERARAQTLRAAELLKTNPNISGVLSEPGVKNAILQFVNNRMPRADLESVLFKALAPSIKDENDRRELISYLAENEIRGRGLIKGTGAISDYEQGILSKIAGSISDPAEVLYKRFRVFDKSNEYNIAARKLWDANDFKSMREFENDPRHKALLKAYVADINNVYNEKVDFTAARNQSAAPDIKYPNDPEKQKRWEEFKKGK